MDEDPTAGAEATEASAELDKIISELGPDQAREIFEMALTELITDQDPDNGGPDPDGPGADGWGDEGSIG